jgi:uncharacterized membrane protein YqhA
VRVDGSTVTADQGQSVGQRTRSEVAYRLGTLRDILYHSGTLADIDMKKVERLFERLLWNSRLITLVAVVASLAVAVVMFYIATADVALLSQDVLHYAYVADEARGQLHATIVAHVAEIVDGYLFATILIIFAMGLYELFVSKIDAIETSPIAPRLLLIRSLDDLKERLAKVVFLILIVRYFQYALEASISAAGSALSCDRHRTYRGLAISHARPTQCSSRRASQNRDARITTFASSVPQSVTPGGSEHPEARRTWKMPLRMLRSIGSDYGVIKHRRPGNLDEWRAKRADTAYGRRATHMFV